MPHQPFSRILPGADTAVLFLHGIIGTPDHFLPLLPHVPETYSVHSVLLDGHGGDVRAFSRTRLAIWRKQCEDAAAELLKTHKHIYIAAHSMGALFALHIANLCPNRVAGLFLLAVPLRIAPDVRIVPGMLRIATGRIPAHDTWSLNTRKAYSLDADPHLWRYIGWIPRYLELFAEMRRTAKLVPLLSVRTIALQSAHDEMVSRHSTDVLAAQPCAQVLILPGSGHYSYSAEDLHTIQSQFSAFVREPSSITAKE